MNPALGWRLLLEFHRCAEWIESALEASAQGLALEDVAHLLTDGTGRYLLWPMDDGCVVTEQTGQALSYWLAAGNMDAMKSIAPHLEEYARRIGASRIILSGRRGWERSFLQERGYALHSVVLVKHLETDK